GNYFSGRVEVGYAPVPVIGKKAVGNSIEDLDKTFLFLELPFKCFPVYTPQLLGDKLIIPFRVLIALLPEIFTGEAGGYLFKKIIKYIVGAVGLGYKPAVSLLFAVGVTQNLKAIKKLPALLPLRQA
ncbi:MAG: hypothetical protein JRD64_07305, partial [Deltaproteobacteria bacterium]|nr:hypothetical protein [Deltaproteobacteria bacterium]